MFLFRFITKRSQLPNKLSDLLGWLMRSRIRGCSKCLGLWIMLWSKQFTVDLFLIWPQQIQIAQHAVMRHPHSMPSNALNTEASIEPRDLQIFFNYVFLFTCALRHICIVVAVVYVIVCKIIRHWWNGKIIISNCYFIVMIILKPIFATIYINNIITEISYNLNANETWT